MNKILSFLTIILLIINTNICAQCYVHTQTFGTELLRHDDSIHATAFSPKGDILVSGVGTDIFIWDTATGKRLKIISKLKYGVSSLDFSPDGRLIILEDSC